MSIHRPYENDLSSGPEGKDQYCYGAVYIMLREELRRIKNFKAKAYIEGLGVVEVTNIGTANNGLRIVSGKNMREPDESDKIFFDVDTIDAFGIQKHLLKHEPVTKTERPETTGVFRKITDDVAGQTLAAQTSLETENEPPVSKTG